MDSRVQFEEWYYDQFGQFEECDRAEVFDIEENDYYRLGARLGWSAWQESRAAIEVELPEKLSKLNTTDNGLALPEAASYDEAIDDCAEALAISGLRYKFGTTPEGEVNG